LIFHKNKDLAVLIPGCGNTYEAEYLLEKVLQCYRYRHRTHISGCFTNKFGDNPNIKVICGDFLSTKGSMI
jgi:hypothetical protein